MLRFATVKVPKAVITAEEVPLLLDNHSTMSVRDQSPESYINKDGTHVSTAVELSSDKRLWNGSQRTTFANDSLESFYKPIETYEGYHRFDPDFQWEPKEEKKLVRKVGQG